MSTFGKFKKTIILDFLSYFVGSHLKKKKIFSPLFIIIIKTHPNILSESDTMDLNRIKIISIFKTIMEIKHYN